MAERECSSSGRESKDLPKKLKRDKKQEREEDSLNLKDSTTELLLRSRERLSAKKPEKSKKKSLDKGRKLKRSDREKSKSSK